MKPSFRRWQVMLPALVLLLAACGTATPVYERNALSVPAQRIAIPALTVSGAGKQEIIIKRDRGMDQSFAMYARVYVDGQYVAAIGNGEMLRLYLPRGEHRFGVKARGVGSADEPVIDIGATIQLHPWPTVFRIFWVDSGFKAGTYTGFVIRPSPV